MCTLVLLVRPGHAWPVVLGANRDEMVGRPWRAPGRHWPERPGTLGGLDEEAGGSWFGVSDAGVLALVLNRRGELGPEPGLRSRGELVLRALDAPTAEAAAGRIEGAGGGGWRPFNLVVADADRAVWLRNVRGGGVSRHDLPPGLSMLAAGEVNDPDSPRIAAHLPLFREAPVPDPGRGDWSGWEALLARTGHPPDDPLAAMTVRAEGRGYGTVSSSLAAIPARGGGGIRWRFAPGPPDRASFGQVA